MQDIKLHKIGSFPIVKHYMEELRIPDLFNQHLPQVKGESIHSECLCVLIQNIIISVRPLYKISDWLKDYTDGQTEFGLEASKYNDDRLGEALDILYESDRHSLMSGASINAIKQYDLSTEQIHNDTTSVTLKGNYTNVVDKGSIVPKQGYNKDGCPDAKQIVFGLNVVADGYVPLLATWHDGNISDSDTHQPNWHALRDLLNKVDFIYIADSKVASIENMTYIANHKGLFISILPASRSEVKEFKVRLMQGEDLPEWETIHTTPHSRHKNKTIVYKTCAAEQTKEGYSLYWIHSSNKAEQDAKRREAQLLKIEEGLTELSTKLNRYYLKTPEQITKATDKILGGKSALFDVQLKENQTIKRVKIGRGRIGKNTQFKEEIQVHYTLEWSLKEEEVEKISRTDGIFPLVTNTELTPVDVLKKYKEQPFLEKRFNTLKSITEIAPVFLKLPHRIEAMLFLYFIALMVIALIEREIRKNMLEEAVEKTAKSTSNEDDKINSDKNEKAKEVEKVIEKLPILPQKMNTTKPTWNNIRYFFEQIFLLVNEPANQMATFLVKGLTNLHKKILRLLKVPWEKYGINDHYWWKFKSI